MNVKQILEVNAAIAEAKAGQFISLDTETTIKRAKKYGESIVTKRTENMVVQNRTSYERRAKAKNPEFVLSPRKWGKRVNGSLVAHTPKGADTEKLYLEAIYNPDSNMAKPKVTYFVDGKETPKEEIEGLPTPRPSASGIDVRTFSADAIKRVKISGKEFISA